MRFSCELTSDVLRRLVDVTGLTFQIGSNSGRVDEPAGGPVELQICTEIVACCSGDVGDQGPHISSQGVEQAALACIGRTCQHDGNGRA